jgi:hypothetical protein
MRKWIIENGIATEEELATIEKEAKDVVLEGRKTAWAAYQNPIKDERDGLVNLLRDVAANSDNKIFIDKYINELASIKEVQRKDLIVAARKVLRMVINEPGKALLATWINNYFAEIQPKYSSHLHSESAQNVLNAQEVAPEYGDNPENADGRMIMRNNFDALFAKYPEVVVFGEDVGNIGDVNQGLEGMQEKYGEIRVSDAGIREATILGQGIGMAMRGLRPIAEIQYLDYLLYALQIMSDDLATLHYRTAGRQKPRL